MNDIKNTIINLVVIVVLLVISFGGGFYYANKRANKSIEAERAEYSKSKQQLEDRINQYQITINELRSQQHIAIANISSGTVTMAGYSDTIRKETNRILGILEKVGGTPIILENGNNS